MKLLWIITLLFNVVNTFAYLGDEGGNGTGNDNPYNGTAWFGKLSTATPLVFCYEVSENFSNYNFNFKQLIQSRMNIWIEYYDNNYGGEFCKNHTPPGGRGSRCLQTNFSIKKKCTGSEDLAFYFGVEPDYVNNEVHINKLKKSAGMAILTSYSINHTFRGKGYIWIASDNYYNNGYPRWNEDGQLKVTLLHEIGHVFGCNHTNGTIMDEFVYERYSKIKYMKNEHADLVDWDRRLVNQNNGEIYHRSTPEYWWVEKQLLKTFKMLVGRASVGKVKASYQFGYEDGVDYSYLTFKDDLSKESFNIFILDTFGKIDYGYAFKVYSDPNFVNFIYPASTGESVLGYVKSKDGKRHQLLINRNQHVELTIKIETPNDDSVSPQRPFIYPLFFHTGSNLFETVDLI